MKCNVKATISIARNIIKAKVILPSNIFPSLVIDKLVSVYQTNKSFKEKTHNCTIFRRFFVK